MSGKNYPCKSILKGVRNPFRPESLYYCLVDAKIYNPEHSTGFFW